MSDPNPDKYDIGPEHRMPLLRRLLSSTAYDDERGCVLWTGYVDRSGYGTIRHYDHSLLVHRIAFVLLGGGNPGLLDVLHDCDIRRCIRHLHLGTHRDNMREMNERGRHGKPLLENCPVHHHPEMVQGENNGNSVLTTHDVHAIRRRYAAGGISYAKLAREFGVEKSTVGYIVRGRLWAHI